MEDNCCALASSCRSTPPHLQASSQFRTDPSAYLARSDHTMDFLRQFCAQLKSARWTWVCRPIHLRRQSILVGKTATTLLLLLPASGATIEKVFLAFNYHGKSFAPRSCAMHDAPGKSFKRFTMLRITNTNLSLYDLRSHVSFNNVALSHISDSEHKTWHAVPMANHCVSWEQKRLCPLFGAW